MALKYLVCVVLCSISIVALAQSSRQRTKPATEPAFMIEQYTFSALVADSGEAKLSVEKTDESTRMLLKSDSDYTYMQPEDAEAIGTALESTDMYWSKFKGSKQDVDETVEAGEFNVIFSNSPKYGFSVYIRTNEGFSLSSASIDRKQAKELSPHFKRSKLLAAHVDKVIDRAIGDQHRK
jgi:hypothetical protein